MFTGIVEEVGTVLGVSRGDKSSVLHIGGEKIFDDLSLGDSVAVNGLCLTVSALAGNSFCADVMHETLSRSSIGTLRAGSRVNLERALKLGGRLGGHIVLGHIDGTGRISKVERDDTAWIYSIDAKSEIMRYIAPKGSVAVDGISLTIASRRSDGFSVSVIPHTAKSTVLSEKSAGEIVNLETDIIGRYTEQFLTAQNGSGITREFLQKYGF